MNNEIDDIILRLTDNDKYAKDICLLLYLSKSTSTIHSLNELEITGKKLETLVYKCLPEITLDSITKTIEYLKSEYIQKEDIHSNLNSNNPIKFIDKFINGEDYQIIYEQYRNSFNLRLKNATR